jgi:undecaprenyl-diphosphatase
MYVVQLAGLVGVPIGLAVLAAARRRPRLALALVLSLPIKELVEHGVLKQVVDRSRPAQNEPGAVLRHSPATQGLAFPSGHAIVAFMVAGLLAPYLPRPACVAAFVLAALICLSRVYLGAHNPLDVLAGAAVGLAIAASLNLILGVPGGRGAR